uniref:CUE domain-containing protein n=1 Tax=Palpitomonas bilix TaxID=652834 RepID=A0A7S3GLN2_9EUKA
MAKKAEAGAGEKKKGSEEGKPQKKKGQDERGGYRNSSGEKDRQQQRERGPRYSEPDMDVIDMKTMEAQLAAVESKLEALSRKNQVEAGGEKEVEEDPQLAAAKKLADVAMQKRFNTGMQQTSSSLPVPAPVPARTAAASAKVENARAGKVEERKPVGNDKKGESESSSAKKEEKVTANASGSMDKKEPSPTNPSTDTKLQPGKSDGKAEKGVEERRKEEKRENVKVQASVNPNVSTQQQSENKEGAQHVRKGEETSAMDTIRRVFAGKEGEHLPPMPPMGFAPFDSRFAPPMPNAIGGGVHGGSANDGVAGFHSISPPTHPFVGHPPQQQGGAHVHYDESSDEGDDEEGEEDDGGVYHGYAPHIMTHPPHPSGMPFPHNVNQSEVGHMSMMHPMQGMHVPPEQGGMEQQGAPHHGYMGQMSHNFVEQGMAHMPHHPGMDGMHPGMGFPMMPGFDGGNVPLEVAFSHPEVQKAMAAMQSTMENLRSNVSKLEKEVSNLGEERDSLKKDVEEKESDAAKLQAELADMQEEVADVKAERDAARKNVQQLDDTLEQTKTEYERSLAAAHQAQSQLQSEIAQLKAELEAEREARALLEEAEKERSQLYSEAEATMKEQEVKLKEAETEVELLTSQIRSISEEGKVGAAVPEVLRAVQANMNVSVGELEGEVMKLVEKHMNARAGEEIIELKQTPILLKCVAHLLMEGAQLESERAKLGLLQTVRAAAIHAFSTYKAESLGSVAVSLSEGELVQSGKARGRGRGRAALMKDPRRREVRSLTSLLFAVAALVKEKKGEEPEVELPPVLGRDWESVAMDVARPPPPAITFARSTDADGSIIDATASFGPAAIVSQVGVEMEENNVSDLPPTFPRPSLSPYYGHQLGAVGEPSSSSLPSSKPLTKEEWNEAMNKVATHFPNIQKSVLNAHLRAANGDVETAAREIVNDMRRGQIGDGGMGEEERRKVLAAISSPYSEQ